LFNVQVGYKTADVVTSGAHFYLDDEHWQLLR
jgi:hypothetical protein